MHCPRPEIWGATDFSKVSPKFGLHRRNQGIRKKFGNYRIANCVVHSGSTYVDTQHEHACARSTLLQLRAVRNLGSEQIFKKFVSFFSGLEITRTKKNARKFREIWVAGARNYDMKFGRVGLETLVYLGQATMPYSGFAPSACHTGHRGGVDHGDS